MDLQNLSPAKLKGASDEALTGLAASIRAFLLDTISKTGGHIGANLGTVELSIALHSVFDSPRDMILWDTGHQGYTQKILTGRANLFPTLNRYGGMNRFLTRAESAHDVIEASHGGTAISIALGAAMARKLRGDAHPVVAVIGDGSLCEGMALEALNHASVEQGLRLVVVLNDNGFAISPGFGALHEYLKTRLPGEQKPETLFTSLGYRYIGPVKGHDISDLRRAFAEANRSKGIPLVHVKTTKGQGWPPADRHPYRMHFSFPFEVQTGRLQDGQVSTGYQDVAARVIGEVMERDDKVMAITPSTLYASGLGPVFQKFPSRCIDPGMEEQHAMTLAVGLALEGMKPVLFYQSTFMQRAFDQLYHDVCFMNLPTLILAVRSGLAGYDNPTHHGIYDLAYLRGLPNLRMLYPKDRFELERMVRDELRSLKGPTYIGMPYGPADEFDRNVLDESPESFQRPQEVLSGEDLVVVTVGNRYAAAKEAVDGLRASGVRCGLLNLRILKPLPEDFLVPVLKRVPRVVSVEEGVLEGGVGSALAALIADHGLPCQLLRIGLPCTFIEPGSNRELCARYGLDGPGLVRKIQARWRF